MQSGENWYRKYHQLKLYLASRCEDIAYYFKFKLVIFSVPVFAGLHYIIPYDVYTRQTGAVTLGAVLLFDLAPS